MLYKPKYELVGGESGMRLKAEDLLLALSEVDPKSEIEIDAVNFAQHERVTVFAERLTKVDGKIRIEGSDRA